MCKTKHQDPRFCTELVVVYTTVPVLTLHRVSRVCCRATKLLKMLLFFTFVFPSTPAFIDAVLNPFRLTNQGKLQGRSDPGYKSTLIHLHKVSGEQFIGKAALASWGRRKKRFKLCTRASSCDWPDILESAAGP